MVHETPLSTAYDALSRGKMSRREFVIHAAALGIGAAPGHVVVSLGTSGTAYAVSDEPTADPTGKFRQRPDHPNAAIDRHQRHHQQFNIYTAAATDLVVDVLGYYSTQLNDSNGQGLLFNPLRGPVLLLNTLAGEAGCYTPQAPMTGGTAYTQASTGACANVPATAQAVVGNAIVVNPVANGYLTFWPSDANQPFIATSNYRTGIFFSRHFTVGLGDDGAFKRYAATTTDLVIDLIGYFAP